MVFDVVGPMFVDDFHQTVKESPNLDAQVFNDMLHADQAPLWEGCETHSKLSAAVRLLNIMSD